MKLSTRESGFTMIEALISFALFTIAIGGVVMALQRGQALFDQGMTNIEVESRLDRAIEKMESLLIAASVLNLNPNLNTPVGGPITWTSDMDWPRVDFVGGAVVDGPVTRLEYRMVRGEVENGVDDNTNELIDERSLIWIDDFGGPNESEVVIVNGISAFLEGEVPNGLDDNGNGLVDERGLAFDLNGNTLNVRLTLDHLGPSGAIIQRSHVASISLRN